ncbi:SH3 domain-containing C40 family peptidase [Paenibacillus sp. CF384]|uniref:C40 family peptidase n=1 Tax=Paenibacillus sp. CF384 TaxID=1884382 RepID=UPI00089AB804|nr:SH3 domain-containing C40 family peptidase [Paenibacillus sp. CF384]SDX65280.1 SH3 domain-containing protein [Paenibacillus sp. CF384]
MKKFTASLLVLILSALLVMPAVMGASPAPAPVVGEIQSSVSFRSAPSTSSTVYKYLKAGDNVVILEQTNASWYKVQDVLGTIAYVSSSDKYIEIIYNASIVSSVSFRKSASTDGTRLRYLSKGESVLVTGQPNSAWFAVTDSKGVKGYVSTSEQYISLGASFSLPSGTKPGSGTGGGDTTPSAPQLIENTIAAGMKYWGTPYEFGSDRDTTTTFDCSDFVRTAFREGAKLTLPADSRKQGDYVKAKGATKSDWRSLKRGDLMFFMEYKGSKASNYAGINKATETITHVGIYLGNGQILHTYSTESGGVRTNDISGGQWENRFLFGGSVL